MLNKEIFNCVDEMKTPVIAQIEALNSLLKNCCGKLSEDDKNLMELTYASCIYTYNLIENFNIIHQLDYSKLYLSYSKFNVSELFKNVLDNYKILFKCAKIKIKTDINNEIIINADKFYIKKAIETLLYLFVNYIKEKTVLNIKLKLERNNFKLEIKAELTVNIDKNLNISTNTKFLILNEIINAHFGKIITENNQNVSILGFIIPI